MNKQDTPQWEEVFRLIDQRRLIEAVDAVRKMAVQFPSLAMGEVTRVEEDYRLMLHYVEMGFNDPERENMYRLFIQRLYRAVANMRTGYRRQKVSVYTEMAQKTGGRLFTHDTIRRELEDAGFVRRREQAGGKGKRTDKAGAKNKNRKEKKPAASEPLHFISAEGFDIYVGKNNLQNEEVTFRLASGQDWWFHAKGRSGSHVIVKSAGTELPDELFVQAASLAAFYSSGRAESKVDVDYVQKREIRKVPGARPGYVIYHTNYSMTVTPGIADGLRQA